MGNQATTIRPQIVLPSASNNHNGIYTQIGENNHQENTISQGITHIDWYIFIFVIGFLLIVIAVLLRYLNICFNKKIDRRTQGEIFKHQQTV